MRWILLLGLLNGCATTGAVALDRAVMAYDRTVVDVVSRLLLLNIARAHKDLPLHFTTVSSIAATFDFRFQAGVGPATTGDLGWLPMPALQGGTSENPTITITPMQGDEFTQRLLTPFDEQKLTMLLRQGYDVDALFRLLGAEFHDGTKSHANRPTDKAGYTRFRQVVAHLSSIQDRNGLHTDALHFRLHRTIPAASMSGADLQAFADDPSLSYDATKQLYELDTRVSGRVVITNYDPATLANDERIRLHEEAQRARPNEVLIDVRADHPGGELPIHGTLRLRSFMNVLAFVGRGVQAEQEYDVPADPRTPVISENPARTLSVFEGAPKNADLVVALQGTDYALEPQQGYQWNKKAFSVLYQLYQMSVAKAEAPSPLITIAK